MLRHRSISLALMVDFDFRWDTPSDLIRLPPEKKGTTLRNKKHRKDKKVF